MKPGFDPRRSSYPERALKAKSLDVLEPCRFELVGFALLTVNFLLRRLLLLEFHRFDNRSVGLRVHLL